MASLYDANTNYQINGVDLRDNPGLVTREYLIDVYPSLIDNFRFAGLWVWGAGGNGQLGTNADTARSSPVQTIAGGTNWKQVSAGYFTAFGLSGTAAAIKTDGTLWTWGGNSSGQLGINDRVHRSSPVQTIAGGTNWKQVSIASDNTTAIKTDGTLWVWGLGNNGQLGTNDTAARSSPVQTIAGGTNWKQVSCGPSHTAAIKTDGTLWTWGFNGSSRLGTNDTAARSSPVQTIAGGTNWKQVSCGTSHTAAIKTDGTLWTWGSGSSGELGDNDIVARSSPVQVGADTNWKQVNFSNASSAAIKTDGTLWVWGSNGNGQLGTNDVTSRSSPVQTIAGSTNWKQVSGRHTYTAAIKTDGTLWIWGSGDNGQLGTNDRVHRSSPVQTIAGGTNWKQVSAGGRDYTLAIRDDSADPFRSEPL